MKILFTQDALINAGAERSHLEILSRFSSEMDVALVYFYPKHELKEAYERAGIRLFFLDIPEAYHFPLAIYRLVKLIRTEKPDLLISSLWRADIITRIASFLTEVPLVGTLVNDSYAAIAWTDKKGLKYKVVYWLDRLTAGIPVHWIANAQALADSHVKTLGIKGEKISVVYRGRPIPLPPRSVPTHPSGGSPHTGNSGTLFSSQLKEESHSVAGEDTGHGQRIQNFISYGRLLERKGFQDAIKAFSQLIKKCPDCTFTIFGEGPYRTQLESLVQNLGLQESVFLPGKIDNPAELLLRSEFENPKPDTCIEGSRSIQNPKSFHCFLFPSWYEGFSGALVEAMMAGIPIIASDIPMNLEAIEDKKSGLVFPVNQVNALASQMTWAIENPELIRELGINARMIAEERFEIEKIAKRYEATLFSIVDSKTSF
ncbi:glycosyltransferase [Algoriphagus confluentis]|uniref:Glycosyltransferase n=1 Tax=Algoriphagus confluentis TaxID=1697556 RepID=A0ABQ6PPV6_9BACT|nr:hypothetical protein Aconfl_22200 [Algoriphagus confluentis]